MRPSNSSSLALNAVLFSAFLTGLVSCGTVDPVSPPERGTFAEAEAMLARAVEHYEKVGKAQALADFTAKKPPFVDRDLYVFCYGADRTVVAHGADAGLVGVNYDDLRDVDGKAFGTEIWEVGNRSDGGTVEYKWLNPVTRKVEPKISVVRKVGDVVCGVGAYKP